MQRRITLALSGWEYEDEMARIAELDGKMRFFTMSEEQQEAQFANYAPDFNNQK